MKNEALTRDAIIDNLVDALKPLDYIYAFYEGGAVSFNRIDEWSDIDLYLVVDEETVNDAFLAVEKTLKSLSPIKQKYEVTHPPQSGIYQAFYKLENASEYLIIDLAVLKLSAPEKFLESEIHGEAVFHFNKSGKIGVAKFDRDGFVKKLKERLERLQARFNMFNIFVQKEINRGNSLEAIDLYHVITFASLMEALRIKHNPMHFDFKMRYVHYELPPEVVKRLEGLYYVEDLDDLQEKYCQASTWFSETITQIAEEESLLEPTKLT